MKRVAHKNAAVVAEQRRIVMSWLRRETTLTDEEIRKHVLEPLDHAAFRAGFEMGYVEAVAKLTDTLEDAMFYKIGFVVLSAAIAASVVWQFIGG